MTTNNDKERIKFLFKNRIEMMGISQNQAATMAGVSGGAISQVFNGSYAGDDSNVYRKLAVWVDYRASNWEDAPTKNQQIVETLLTEAKTYSQCFAIVGPAGCGKSGAFRMFSTSHKNVIHLTCGEHWNKSDFLNETLLQLGRNSQALTISDKMFLAVKLILNMENPLFILDEADKLPDNVLIFFITLYNKLEDNAGLVMSATDHLVKRIERGVKYNKKGYNEIYSRIGRKFIELKSLRAKDVELVCLANKIDDKHVIASIVQESEGDLRRVKRAVHVAKLREMTDNG
jgi:DNA transposition AAA+ family ATPase